MGYQYTSQPLLRSVATSLVPRQPGYEAMLPHAGQLVYSTVSVKLQHAKNIMLVLLEEGGVDWAVVHIWLLRSSTL